MKKYVRLAAIVFSGLLMFCFAACNETTTENLVPVTEAESTDQEEMSTLSPEELVAEVERTTMPASPTERAVEMGDSVTSETMATAVPEVSGIINPEESASVSETIVPEVEQPLFGISVFLGKSTDNTERYFLFTTPTDGVCIAQKDGASAAMTYGAAGDNIVAFNMNDTVSKAEVSWIDTDTVMFLWENGMTETLTRLPNNPNEPFVFYSTDDLCQRALVYYEQKTGYRPSQVGAMLQVDGTVAIQLYDNLIDHNTTSAWYTIDRYTGIGTDVMCETIDLSQVVLE